MSLHNLEIARWYLDELWSRGRFDGLPDRIAPTCTVRDPLFGECVGADGLRTRVVALRRAFPDLRWRVGDILAEEGAQLALTWSATAQWVEVSGLLLLRFDDAGRLVAITARWEPDDLLRRAVTAPPRPPRLARGSTPAISTAVEESDVDAHWEL